MRTQLLAGKLNLVYPEEVTFLYDRNIISLQNVAAVFNAVGGTFSFSNGTETVQISYNSERDFLVFDLYSVLKKLAGDDSTDVTVTGGIICGETSADITSFTLKVIKGRTLESHSHCAERIVYFSDPLQLSNIGLLSLNDGTVGGVAVSSGITKFNFSSNTSDFAVPITDGNESRTVMFRVAAVGGSSDAGTEECAEGSGDESSVNGYMAVRYLNTDGCLRYLNGKVLKRKRSVGINEWRANDIVRNTPNYMIVDHTDEVTLGFPSVHRLSYAEDIMFSPTIEYQNEDGEWKPCEITSKSLTLDKWDLNDIEITVQTLS